MSDEITVDPNHVRKTVSLTHKQAGIGAGLVAAILSIQPLRDMFVTKDENKSTIVRLDKFEMGQRELKDLITKNEAEAVRRSERVADKIMDRIKEAETRTTANQDRQEHRMDTLEASILIRAKKTY